MLLKLKLLAALIGEKKHMTNIYIFTAISVTSLLVVIKDPQYMDQLSRVFSSAETQDVRMRRLEENCKENHQRLNQDYQEFMMIEEELSYVSVSLPEIRHQEFQSTFLHVLASSG